MTFQCISEKAIQGPLDLQCYLWDPPESRLCGRLKSRHSDLSDNCIAEATEFSKCSQLADGTTKSTIIPVNFKRTLDRHTTCIFNYTSSLLAINLCLNQQHFRDTEINIILCRLKTSAEVFSETFNNRHTWQTVCRRDHTRSLQGTEAHRIELQAAQSSTE